MAGALEGTVINPNVEIAIVGEIATNEGERNDNVIQLRRQEIDPKIEIASPVEVRGGQFRRRV